MKRIIAFLDENTNKELVVKSTIHLAKLLNRQVLLCHLVTAPVEWELMSRSLRDKYPSEKNKINEARLVMDELLSELRSENVNAKKQFLYFNSDAIEQDFDFESDEILIIDAGAFNTHKNQKLNDFLIGLKSIKLFIKQPFNHESISDIVLTSNFKSLNDETIEIISCFESLINFNLNLVYINTPSDQENSEISIENIKNVISQNGLSKTGISIFYSDSQIKGAKLFADLKGGDLIIVESTRKIDYQEFSDINCPIMIINK